MRNLTLYLVTLLILTGIACQRKSDEAAKDLPAGMHAATVIEVKQTSNYTYFNVFENGSKFWMATNPLQGKAGDVVYYTRAFEMKDFHSKELDKTFESIMFVEDASLTAEALMPKSPGKVNPGQVEGLEVAAAPNGISISELYQNKEKYAGKEVSIRGMIIKHNRNIMGKNWAHIQDGTSFNQKYDLTVTTTDSVAQGQVVVFTGKISLDKDFGHGYAYDILMEDAKASEIESVNPHI